MENEKSKMRNGKSFRFSNWPQHPICSQLAPGLLLGVPFQQFPNN